MVRPQSNALGYAIKIATPDKQTERSQHLIPHASVLSHLHMCNAFEIGKKIKIESRKKVSKCNAFYAISIIYTRYSPFTICHWEKA